MESKKTIFTKGEIILAILLSIFVYTAFWALGIFIGILMGTVVPIAIGMVLPVIVIFAFRKKIKNRKTATMAVSTFLALLIGQFCYQLGKVTGEIPRFALFSLASVFLGGVVTGSIGYKDFLSFMKKKVFKYAFLASLVFVVVAVVLVSFFGYHSLGLDLPIEYVRPTKVSSGWTLKKEASSIFWTELKYEKEGSFLRIGGSRFYGSPKTKEGYRHQAEMELKAMELLLESERTLKFTSEKIGDVKGHLCYMFYFDIISKGDNIPNAAFVWYYWYCDKTQRDYRASYVIKRQAISEHTSEVEEMVNSIRCH